MKQKFTQNQLVGLWRCKSGRHVCDWSLRADGTFEAIVTAGGVTVSHSHGTWELKGGSLAAVYAEDKVGMIRRGLQAEDTLIDAAEDYFIIETRVGTTEKYERVRDQLTSTDSPIMKVLKVEEHLGGDTDVSLEAPEFENFGNRLEEMQDLADQANATDPEEVRASTAGMMEQVKTAMEEARKKHEAMPAGPKKEMDSMMMGMLEELVKTAAEAQEESDQPDDEDEGGDAEESVEEERNPHLLELHLRGEIKWNKDTESVLERFFADWPGLRLKVLQAIFKYYRGIYPELVDAYDYHKGRQFFIPEPTSPEAIQEIFYIQSIHLQDDGSMGLSGHCTWDEEHGFGVRLKDGEVTEAGAADIAS